MGAWSYKILCDDMTLDAVSEWFDSDNLYEELESCLDEVLEGKDDYIDYDMGAYGLAAAAVVDAIVNGIEISILTDNDELDEDFTNMVESADKEQIKALLSKAAEVTEYILGEESELNELWMENEEEYTKWQNNIKLLQSRLASK